MAAGEEARAIFDLVPDSSGEKTIAAKFESRELKDVDGVKTIRVSPGRRTGNNGFASSYSDVNSNTLTTSM